MNLRSSGTRATPPCPPAPRIPRTPLAPRTLPAPRKQPAPRTPLALLALALTTGCAADAATPRAAGVVRDSAGVAIVENTGEPTATWRVAAQPSLEIGVVEGDPSYQLFRVRGVLRLPDGRIAVANGGSHEVRFYDAAGRFIRAGGRRGGGPGEFESIARLARFRGDSLVVHDTRHRRVTLLTPAGDPVRDVSIADLAGRQSTAAIAGALESGVLVARRTLRAEPLAEGFKRDSVEVVLLPFPGGGPVPLGVWPGRELFERTASRGRGIIQIEQSSLPFSRNVWIAAGGDRVFVASNDAWDIRVHRADGTLERIIRRTDRDAAPVDAALLDRHIDTIVARRDPASTRTPGDIRDAVLSLPRVASVPVHGEMLVDDAGSLWVRHYTMPWAEPGPIVWTVFDDEGRLSSVVETPADLTIHQIGRDFIIGVARNDLDVEMVRLYALERDGG